MLCLAVLSVGYTLDAWKEWHVLCLAVLSVEDIEDIYLIGLMISGFLLLSSCMGLVYRKIGKTAALEGAPKLPVLIIELRKVVDTQAEAIAGLNRLLVDISEKNASQAVVLSDLARKLDSISEKQNRLLADLSEKNGALHDQGRAVASQAVFLSDLTRKLDSILEKQTTFQGEMKMLMARIEQLDYKDG